MDTDTKSGKSTVTKKTNIQLENKSKKSQIIFKNPTVILTLAAIGVCFSTCTYGVATAPFLKTKPLLKQNILLTKPQQNFERDSH